MFGNMPTKILKQNGKSCFNTLQKLFNDALRHGNFPDKLICADIMPVFIKDDSAKAKNDFYKTFYKQIRSYIDQFLSLYMYGYANTNGSFKSLRHHQS